jgi:hypothetical protein
MTWQPALLITGFGSRDFARLADLLVQLTDRQLRDLFEVARVDFRSRKPGSTEPPATVGDWVTAFKSKRHEIVTTRCKS